MPGIAVVLGGGGARGLAHIGVLHVLREMGVTPQYFVGTSIGGVIGALAASGLSPTQLTELARNLRWRSLLALGGDGGLLCTEPIGALLAEYCPPTFEELHRCLAVVAADLDTGRLAVLREGPLLPALQATIAVPGLWAPVVIAGHRLVDGSIVNNLPVDVARALGAGLVIAVDVGHSMDQPLPWELPAVHSVVERLRRALGMQRLKAALAASQKALCIMNHRLTTLTLIMSRPDVLITPRLDEIGVADFGKAHRAIAAGIDAAGLAAPLILEAMEHAPSESAEAQPVRDPVCDLAIDANRAVAVAHYGGKAYYFWSKHCQAVFEADPERYLQVSPPAGAPL